MENLIKIFTLFVFSLLIHGSFFVTPVKAVEHCCVTSVKASHILVNSKEEALSIKNKIDKGANFEEMAQKYSKCPSGKEGGDLGYFTKGQMVKSFETASFSLPLGVVSEPIQTDFGWHLIKVYDKK